VATRASQRVDVTLEGVVISTYTIPTEEPESDGTLEWDATTIVVVEVEAGGCRGLGYTYGAAATGKLIEEKLVDVVVGRDLVDVHGAWVAMGRALRNVGRPGLGSMAIAAVDIALWDLHARLLDAPLATVLGVVRDEVPIYGSGGFTSLPPDRVAEQLGGWSDAGIPRVKMKVGREPGADPARIEAARRAIGNGTELFVDANGAFERKEALEWAPRYAHEWGVTWFEEPVSSADFDGLRLLRDQSPPEMDIAAGEYAYVRRDFENLLDAGAVDCLQADVTRCSGFSGLLEAAQLAGEHGLDISGHCAPAASVPVLCAVDRLRHLEWFHDHVRVERLLFDGVPEPDGGVVRADLERPGLGLDLKRADAARFAA
jgi:L-alanine-DL-glutamate epimerase-like enolase superfamily enzyme